MLNYAELETLEALEKATPDNDTWNKILADTAKANGISVENLLALIEKFNEDPDGMKAEYDEYIDFLVKQAEAELEAIEGAENPVTGCDPYNDEALLQGVT